MDKEVTGGLVALGIALLLLGAFNNQQWLTYSGVIALAAGFGYGIVTGVIKGKK